MKWKLENVETKAKQYPDTFKIPELYERKGLEPGMFAKLIFLQGESGERMWVEVKRRLGPGRYEGVLANSPFSIAGLEFGDILKFEAKNVADIAGPGAASGEANYTMNGVFDAFEIWRSDTPRPEVMIDEGDLWYYAAPEEVKKRSRGRAESVQPSERRPFGRSVERPGVERENPKDWSPNRPSRFGGPPRSFFNFPRREESEELGEY